MDRLTANMVYDLYRILPEEEKAIFARLSGNQKPSVKKRKKKKSNVQDLKSKILSEHKMMTVHKDAKTGNIENVSKSPGN
ncbi:hypothetical protein [Abyssalbus ytuae]|uniref:Uncharacterized protein n=1 Tax=Abyssalbus ytuae TaxID=2926907 RepID=A0A9E7CUK8_9FLAO|nr:hypothetical protein [Abyssalbus ytuae]UOB18612.1 hypothetical protein MQE35_04810 [Abyssalbus ytuae]